MTVPRLVLASLSGEADADWARAGSEYADLAILGGVALDDTTQRAAEEMVAARDRTEFLPEDPISFVTDQLDSLAETPIRAGFNVRTTTLAPLREVARECATRDAWLELNAHCRQDEMCAVGAGEFLLSHPEALVEQVAAAASEGAAVSVKVRAAVDGVDLPALAARLDEAGAAILHVDAMDSEHVIADCRATFDGFLVANNGVRGRESVAEYLGYGADAVSVGRPSDNPRVLRRVRRAVDGWFTEESADAA